MIISNFIKINKYLSLLLISFLLGCQTPPLPINFNNIPTTGQIEEEDLYFFLVSDCKLVPSMGSVIGDRYYNLPTPGWIETVFRDQLIKGIKDKIYTLEAYDCENYSLFAHNLSSELGRKETHQLAIGEIWYIKDLDSRGHAINFFICLEKSKLCIYFLEPQTGEIINLTKTEKETIIHWRI